MISTRILSDSISSFRHAPMSLIYVLNQWPVNAKKNLISPTLSGVSFAKNIDSSLDFDSPLESSCFLYVSSSSEWLGESTGVKNVLMWSTFAAYCRDSVTFCNRGVLSVSGKSVYYRNLANIFLCFWTNMQNNDEVIIISLSILLYCAVD